MNRTRVIWAVIVGFALLILTFSMIRDSAGKRSRAEVRVLEILRAEALEQLSAGTGLPTNWSSLSNSRQWDLIVEICDYNKLPSPPKAYTLLSQSVTGSYHSGAIFFVRSKPYRRSPGDLGRWALAASSNQVKRIWIPEPYLAPEILSQIKN